ncbi:hypothetical protein MBLNU457_4616t1 [Dothideomycetes sp. NU457]
MAAISTFLYRAASLPVLLIVTYAGFILLLTIPWLQRNALYAHKVNTTYFHNVSRPEQFGFAKNQVTPFNISTPDGETLFAWHVLPLDIYALHQETLTTSPPTLSTRLSLIKNDPDARIVINFHGNAGHIAQGWRTDTYLRLSSLPHTHIFTIDYRGFGHSSGTPTETGLITDGVALIDYVLATTELPADRLTLLGQSLGTAVASAVTLYYADPSSGLLPALPGTVEHKEPRVFAGTVLVAPFSSLPSLLLTYRIGGVLPVLAPLRPYPVLQNWLNGYILDKWRNMDRLVAYVDALERNPELKAARARDRELGSLQILHAVNDRDISFQQSRMLWKALSGEDVVVGEKGPAMRREVDGREAGRPRVGVEFLEYGGHNRIVTFAQVALAVGRAFEGR